MLAGRHAARDRGGAAGVGGFGSSGVGGTSLAAQESAWTVYGAREGNSSGLVGVVPVTGERPRDAAAAGVRDVRETAGSSRRRVPSAARRVTKVVVQVAAAVVLQRDVRRLVADDGHRLGHDLLAVGRHVVGRPREAERVAAAGGQVAPQHAAGGARRVAARRARRRGRAAGR